jgi:peptide/nickel transport system substrate-binding protein
MRHRLPALIFALLAFVGLGARPSLAEPTGTLTIGVTQFPSTMNPSIDSMLAKSYVLAMTQRPVTAYDDNWQLVCLLCTELPTIENGQAVIEPLPPAEDGKVSGDGQGIAVTYRLQPEATWGDGTPVTSADMVFTWEVGRHPDSGVSSFEVYRRILSIDVIDDKTFTLHIDRITYAYNALGFDLLPAHVERPIFEADPAEYRHRTAYDSDPANPGLAFGPYRIVRMVSGAEIELAPNPTWWGSPPAFARVVVRVIANTAAIEANLLSGAIDMIAGELGLTVDQALAFEERHGADYNIVYKPGLIYEHIDLNLDNPVLADRRLRRALLHALDREAISSQLFGGRQPVADSNVSPLDWVHSQDAPRYPYDPEAAARLLDEAGWGDLRGGLRHNAEGEPLRLEIMTTAGNRTRELVEQVLQSQWRELGIEVTIRNEPARVFFGETVGKRKFPAMAMFAWLSSPESVPLTTLRSDQVPSADNAWSGQNYTGYRNPEMDRLIDRIERELDRETRRGLWVELQRLYAEDLPALPLYWRAEPYVLPSWLAGLRPTGHQGTTTLWIEDWHRRDD